MLRGQCLKRHLQMKSAVVGEYWSIIFSIIPVIIATLPVRSGMSESLRCRDVILMVVRRCFFVIR